MDLNHQTVFLAGSTGLAGSGILRRLLRHFPGTRIRAAYYSHLEPFVTDPRVEYVRGDLRSEQDTRSMVRGCDCAVMAAAVTGGARMAIERPAAQVNDNLIMNARLLESFRAERVNRVVWIGSASLYQETDGRVREDDLDLNRDPHPAYFGLGWVLRAVEKLCRFWHDQFGLEIVIARASNIYGPYAKFDPETSNFIPAIIRKAVDHMDPFEVWGRPDVTRDVVYVDDLADAAIAMMEHAEIKFGVFNVGAAAATVETVVQEALKSAGHRPSRIEYQSDRPMTLKSRLLDCSKAADRLGWRPRHSLEEGIRLTTEWWIQNKERWKK